ncbi:MAG: hypothetical protein M1281_09285 [Chloroflexi bacterium]|nr:hypothetical protein [Chloroflexota bacterium]
MKSRFSFIAVALFLAIILLMFPASVQATPSQDLTITANLVMTGQNSAAGSFEVSGLVADHGNASEVFFIADNTIHGVKTMVGADGTITIKFQAQLAWTSQTAGTAEGQFVILSGTGAYEKLHGVGATDASINLAALPYPTISATYTGTAHMD